jgi:formate/nitrite transporter
MHIHRDIAGIETSPPETHRTLDFGARMERPGMSDIPAARQAVPPESIAPGDLTPGQTAQRLVEWSAAKSVLSADRLIVLGLLAGAFIAIGGAFFTGVMAEASLGHGPSRLLGGIVFSSGLLLVCVSGAELSTGNCMLVAAWACRRLTLGDVGRNLLMSYAANAAGALALVVLMAGSGLLQSGHGGVAAAIAEAKMHLSFEQAFVRGVLCNALVCIAVWMMLSARTIPAKLAGLIFPISAFITLGFEHSIANFYLLPAGLLAGAAGSLGAAVANLIAVTLGNLVGGLAISLAIWMAYLRGPDSEPACSTRFSLGSRRTTQVPLSG